MEVTGAIVKIDDTKEYGANGFRKREIVIKTNEQYPQTLLIEFIQDKCDLLNNYKAGEDVKISINLRGREWVNPEGKTLYFNSIQGWRIEKKEAAEEAMPPQPPLETFESTENVETDDKEPDDLPF